MTIFTEALKLIEENKIEESFRRPEEKYYLIEAKSSKEIDKYPYKIYRKGCSWYSQCGCNVGVLNKPSGLCKHHIGCVILEFLRQNNLKLCEDKINSGGKTNEKNIN